MLHLPLSEDSKSPANLAAVPNSRDADTATRQETSDPLGVLPPLVAQGPLGIDLLGKGLSMLTQIKPHGCLDIGLADAKPAQAALVQ